MRGTAVLQVPLPLERVDVSGAVGPAEGDRAGRSLGPTHHAVVPGIAQDELHVPHADGGRALRVAGLGLLVLVRNLDRWSMDMETWVANVCVDGWMNLLRGGWM